MSNETIRKTFRALCLLACWAITVATARAQVASQSADSYWTAGVEKTINCQFAFPAGRSLYALAWVPELPPGWTLTGVTGQGAPELDPYEDAIIFIGALSNPVVFSYTAVPTDSAFGTVHFGGYAEYTLNGMVNPARAYATPFDLTQLHALSVASDYGTPVPGRGTHVVAHGTVSTNTIDERVMQGTTQYVCTGWTLVGHAPSSGATTNFSMTVTNSAALTWQWAAVTNPVPALTSVSPGAVTMGGAAFTLVVKGAGFAPAALVKWNGAERATVFVSATELRAQIPSSDIVHTGFAAVTVTNPAPGGGTGGPLGVHIVPDGEVVFCF